MSPKVKDGTLGLETWTRRPTTRSSKGGPAGPAPAGAPRAAQGAQGPQAQGPPGTPATVAFPQTLWGPMIRNQQGAAQSTLDRPRPGAHGDRRLKLSPTGNSDLAAFGGLGRLRRDRVGSITSLSYSSYNPDASRGAARASAGGQPD